MDTVPIETEPWFTNRHGKIEAPILRKNPCKFPAPLQCTVRIKGITVTPQFDMLGDMQAR